MLIGYVTFLEFKDKLMESQKDKYCIFHLYEVATVVKFIETESRMIVANGWGRGEWGTAFNMHRILILHDENF